LLSDRYYSPELSNEGENNTANEPANNTTDSQETSGDEYYYGTAPVESIKIMPLESFPVQMQVVAEGYFSNGCPKIDKITTEREGNTFNIKISTKSPKDAICTQAIVPFSKAIPLEIQGLKAGKYTVNVNGIKGSFELAVDNSLNEFPSPLPPGKKVITEADNGTSISLREGENFTLKLRGNPSTDYSWEFNLSEGLRIISDNEELSTISDNYVQDPASEHMVGVPGTYSWIIEAVAPGNQQVKGIYKQYLMNTTGTEDNFTLNVYSISSNTTSRLWDFGDGTFSTEQNPTHTYSAAGNYTVSLIVSNVNGSASKTSTITVIKSNGNSSSENRSHHSSSGGGGGAGGSPEPAKNVEAKELCQVFVTNGKTAQFDFTKNATCVVSVSFDAKKTAGKTTTIAEQLKGNSTLVSELPAGETYKSFNVWVGNGGVTSSKNIENPVVCFKVEKSWIKDKKIDQDSITLNRYNDTKWEQSPLNLSGEDEKFLYFTAKTSGFSSFAITGTAKPSPEETVTKTEIDYPETINKNNATNKEPQNEQKEILSTPGFEIYYGVAGMLAVLLYKRK
jgi:PGF-pre-PGF domain-containing protein